MSLDHMLAACGACRGKMFLPLSVLGLGIPLIVFASKQLSMIMEAKLQAYSGAPGAHIQLIIKFMRQ